jgi:tetratricopeptide (TPR) repeat protein
VHDSRTKSSIDFWIGLALLAATFAVYFQTRAFDFVNYDDPDYVTDNMHVRDGITVEGLGWALTSGDAANWFPVTRISHMLDCQIFGVESGWHHLTNVVIHGLAALLLFAFLHLATRARWPSAFVALVFALHPLHVESVAWVAERKDVLCAFFWFLALWAYVRYTRQPSRARYLLLLAAFCLGLMAKPMIVTLPFVLVLLDVWPLRRPLALREKLPLFALAAAAAVVTFLVQKSAGAVETVTAVPLAMRLENAAVTYIVYIAKTFWPTGLAVFYPYPISLPAWQPVLAGLAILAISGLVLAAFCRVPYLAVGWLWYLGTLVPVIGLVQVGSQSRADRYMYVPMVGLTIMLAWGAVDVLGRWPGAKRVVAVVAAVGCAGCVPLTWTQAGYWKNSEVLFQHALAVTTGNPVAEHDLGSYLLDQPGRLPDAIHHLQAALGINPDSAATHSDLATALSKSGRPSEAVPEYQAALRLNPDSAIVHNNYANALLESGHRPQAVAEYQLALRLKPDYTDARKNLAIALATPPPESAEAHYDKGVDNSHAGRLTEAIAEFEAALRLRPDYAEAQNNLGVALTQIPARAAEAPAHFQAAVKIDPDYADARLNLGIALSQIPGRLPEAITQLEAAYRLHPDPELRQTLERLRTGR